MGIDDYHTKWVLMIVILNDLDITTVWMTVMMERTRYHKGLDDCHDRKA